MDPVERHPVTVYVGAPGYGKSYAMMADAHCRPRVIALDPEIVGGRPDTVPKGFRLAGLREIRTAARERATMRLAVDVPHYEGRVVNGKTLQASDVLEAVCADLFAYAEETPDARHTTVVVDEWYAVYTEGGASRRNMPAAVASMLTRGRKRRLSMMIASQRRAHLHPEVWQAAERVVLFRQHHRGDIELLRRDYGRDVAERIARLPKYVALEWTNGVWSERQPKPGR